MVKYAAQWKDDLTNATLNATWYSSPLNVMRALFIGWAVRTTGTMVGTWVIQYSNDYNEVAVAGKQVAGIATGNSDTLWDTYTTATTPPAASGSAQTFGVTLDNYEFAFVRLKFVYTSGSGSAFLFAQMKG